MYEWNRRDEDGRDECVGWQVGLGERKLATVNEEKGKLLGAKLDELSAHVLERRASHSSPILAGQSEASRKSGA